MSNIFTFDVRDFIDLLIYNCFLIYPCKLHKYTMTNIVYFETSLIQHGDCPDVITLKGEISQRYGIPVQDLFATLNGKPMADDAKIENTGNVVRICTKLIGGKGGFGSMLRAIGAQIEKTTNREACRDLSGRRLRDINEEKRLRKWLEGQEEREKEAAERKQKKIERLIAAPIINVDLNPDYEREREELPERVSEALEAGWEAAGCSDSGLKRKTIEERINSKRVKLWVDDDLSDCSSVFTEDEEQELELMEQALLPNDSGHDSDRSSSSSQD